MSKKTIEVPVSRLSYQILTSRYGHPLNVNRHTHKELCIHLQLCPVQSSTDSNNLTRLLHITLPSSIGSKLSQRNLVGVGVLLHRLHIIRLYDYILTQTKAPNSKVSAYAAMKQFYNDHDITDDDFSFESAYRGWLRYKNNLDKNRDNFQKNDLQKPRDLVTPRIQHLQRDAAGRRMRYSTITSAVDRIGFQAPRLFRNAITRDILIIYLAREFARLSYRDIARRLGRSYTTIRYHHTAFIDRTTSDTNLRIATIEVLKYLSNMKINVLYR